MSPISTYTVEQIKSMALFAKYNPAPVFRFDKEGHILQANDATEEIFADIISEGGNAFNLIKRIEKDKVEKCIQDGDILTLVEDINGKSFRFELRGIPDLKAMQVYGADISEIINAQYENTKLSTAVSQTSNSVMITDLKGNIEFVNNAFEIKSGYTREDVIGKNPRILKTNYLSKETYQNLWKIISSGGVWKGEFHNRRKDGSTYWEEATISPIKDKDGSIQNYIAVKEDITEQKKAEEEVHSMALFAKLNPEPVFRFDAKGIVLQSNPAANHIFNVKSLVNADINALIPELSDLNFTNFIKNNELLTITSTIGDKILRFILRGLSDLNMCQIYGSDITERVKAQQKIEEQKKSITDSIQYASRIQSAILPNENILNSYFSDHFIYFKPRDIVSGDFYWMTEKDNRLILVAADCTGHGVPGALMSMLGISFLNEIINKQCCNTAAGILDELRRLVITTLSQSGQSANDGMDISLIIYDKNKKIINYAGAYNHLYLVKNNELEVIKADRMPIGNHIKDEVPFTNQFFNVDEGDLIYLHSDGYADQFGEVTETKFTSKKLKALLTDINDKTGKQQKQILDNEFNTWKGNNLQIDDVLLIGIKI